MDPLNSRNCQGAAVALAMTFVLAACSNNQAPGPRRCEKVEDCGAEEICHQGACRDGCVTSNDCKAPQECISGGCLFRCGQDRDCPPGEECRFGFCQPTPEDKDGGSDADGDNRGCIDLDNDGFGRNCPAGPDCDDQNARIYPGAEEVCGDSQDNDCDNEVDEGCVCTRGTKRFCSSFGDPLKMTEEMLCRPGLQLCENGSFGDACVGEVGPAAEVCNNLDDDCDGQVDEGLLNAVGVCAEGHQVPDEDCGPTGEGNGLDDNGDGQVDEGCSCATPDYDPSLPRRGQPCYSGPIHSLGVGLCQGGARDCGPGGVWGPCRNEITPVEEVCGDFLDNDCDGFVDEGCLRCVNPTDEVCDGRDNDCDGVVDEGVLNRCGACGLVAEEEICGDGLDNNCDGTIDEGCGGCSGELDGPCYPGPAEIAGKGACTIGAHVCDGEFWGECMGYVLPGPELCGPSGLGNGSDDDCDGLKDEDCGCMEGEERFCGLAGGLCEYGTQVCADHQWGACTGGVGVQPEVCDENDNDCDGLNDEGLLNACGTCGESCYQLEIDPTLKGNPDEGVVLFPAGDPENPTGRAGITLSKRSFIPPYLWAANHTDNSVSKFNTDLEIEEGRYWVGSNPSRTAVDLDGNMWVGGRDDGRLTKVLWDTTACPDRNTSGLIETSRNVGGVVTQINSAADPFADECVVYSAVPNASRTSIRGIAAAPDGQVWIGYTGGGLQWIDPNTFEVGPFFSDDAIPRWTIDANGVLQPLPGQTADGGGVYGLVVDSQGFLYISSVNRRDTLACFDTNTEQWVALYEASGACSYGIAVDAHNRIWLGGYPSCGGVRMFDPVQRRFYTFLVPSTATPTLGETTGVIMPANGGPGGEGRFQITGVGVEPATGNVWASFYPIGYTGRLIVNEQDFAQSQWILIGTTRDASNNQLSGVGVDLRGVGFDRNGFAWTLGLGSDRVFKLDPATNARAASLPEGKSVGVGSHYTYSDFTGSTALSFTAPRGFWRYVFQSQFDNAQVDAIVWEAYVPAGTTAGVRIRALDINGTPLSGWLPPDNVGVPVFFEYPSGAAQQRVDLAANGGPLTGRGFEVEVRLTTNNRDVRPIVHDLRLAWQRP